MSIAVKQPSTVTAYTEREAARRLGMVPQTLRYWREHGWLRDGVLQPTPGPAGRARVIQRYDAAIIDAAASGGDPVYITEPETA